MKYSIEEQIIHNDKKLVEFKKIQEITESEFNELNNHIEVINLYFHIEDYFLIIERNFKDLITFIDTEYKSLENSQLGTFMNPDFLKISRIEINRKIINYLSSSRTFIDYLSKILKKQKKGNVLKNFLTKIYDDNFSYRFYYKLRNYSQHIGLPLTWISVDVSDLKNRNLIFAYDISFLLSDYDSWSTVKIDLEKFGNNKLDAKYITIKCQENLEEIYKFSQNLLDVEIDKAIITIENLINEFKTNHQLVIVIEENKNTTRTIPIQIQKIQLLKNRK